jgi:TolB-like protein/Tfp pilus assembly protein PilF
MLDSRVVPVSPDPLRATLFGNFRLLARDGTEIALNSKRTQALLAMLCLAPGVAIDRDQLSQLLWRGKFSAHARASLRQTLLGLNKLLAPVREDFLEVTRERVAVNAEAVQTDLAELEQALRDGTATSASELLLAIGGKALLDRLDLGEPFNQWLAGQRAEVDQRLRLVVDQVLADCRRCGDSLAEEQLRAAWRLRDAAATLPDSDRRVRIAVLPFQWSEADEELGPIGQGLFDELVTSLGKAPQLLVAGRASSLLAGKMARPLPQIAQALHVSYLLEGSIQRQQDELRIHVGLVDGASGFEHWSHSYRGASDDLFALQAEIAGEVTRELGEVLGRKMQAPGRRRATTSRTAYELYLQGRALTARAIGDGVLAKAVELLERSLQIDPQFAACWTALAEAYAYTAVYTPCLDRVAKSARMAECAAKAIALDPQQGHARAMLGIHRWTENDPVGALDLAHEAYRLEPDNPDVVLRLGSFLLYIGRTREALPYIETAIDLDPFNGRYFAMLSVAHLNLGDIGKAIAAGHRMVDLGLPSMWLAVATAASGNHKFAVEQYWQTRLLMNTVIFPPAGTKPLTGSALDTYWRVAARGVCSGRAVHRTVYCTMLDYLHATLPDPCDTSIVAPAIWMGYAKMVFKTLGTQITPANMYCVMSLWADVEPIRRTREHPGFLPFAERIGLRAAWDKYGWPDLLPCPQPARVTGPAKDLTMN